MRGFETYRHIVPDTSVAGKWYLDDESLVQQARLLFRFFETGEVRAIVPSCFWYELGGLVRRSERRRRISGSAADRIMRDIQRLRLPELDCHLLLVDAHDVSRAFDVSLYDAFFLVTATLTDSALITADVPFYTKTRVTGNVYSLEEISLQTE